MTRKTMLLLISIVLAAGCQASSPGATTDAGDFVDVDAAPQQQPDAAAMPDAMPRPTPDAGCTPGAPDPIDPDGIDSKCDGFDGVVADEIFVAPDGDDANPGTPGFPVATIAHAYILASGRPILVAAGTYAEDVSIRGGAINLHGGYDRSAGWTRTDVSRRSTIVTSARGVQLRELTFDSELDRIDVTASNTTLVGETAFGLRASGNVQLTLRESHIAAGNADQIDHLDGAFGATGAVGFVGGVGHACAPTSTACNIGGAGGASSCGHPGLAGAPSGGAATGGMGLAGNPGANGASAANFGTLNISAYVPSVGGSGGLGADGTGSGGGGGGGSDDQPTCPAGAARYSNTTFTAPGASGGGGGGGGCAGHGGSGGTSGAGSFGVVVSQTRLVLVSSTIASGKGAPGGAGGNGGAGGSGGPGGAGGGTGCNSYYDNSGPRPVLMYLIGLPGSNGSNGASGGRGGHGGGGAGGPSIGVARLAGATLMRDMNSNISFGPVAAGGTSAGNAGPSGLTADDRAF